MKKIYPLMFAVMLLAISVSYQYIAKIKTPLEEKSLVNTRVVSEYSNLKYADSHIYGCTQGGGFAGGGMLYYGIVSANLPKVAVVIGSGAGFVPRIVAQAQRDSEDLSPDSITYFIDADIDITSFDSGQNYGAADLVNVRLDKNLFMMKMRSSYAAQLFKNENIKIDYLHIDGDHSVKGIVEDWKYFYRLLSKDAVITFHDLNSVRDVEIALKQIKQISPTIEYIVFNNAGVGVVVAQLGGLSVKNAKACSLNDNPSKKLSYFANRNVMSMEDAFIPKEWLKNFKSYDRIFYYLKEPRFLRRYELAAEYIDDGSPILEIGGFPNSIINYTKQNKATYLVEKYGTNQWAKTTYLEGLKKHIDLRIYPTPDDFLNDDIKIYNLIQLGLHLEYDMEMSVDQIRQDVKNLFKTYIRSRKSVIEVSDFFSSLNQFRVIQSLLHPKIVKTVQLDNRLPDKPTDQTAVSNIYFIDGFYPEKNWNSDENINRFIEAVRADKLLP